MPVPAKCASRLHISSIAWNYYHETDREVTANRMNFMNTLRDFNTEWDAILTISKQDASKVPLLSKKNTSRRWI